MLTTEFEQGTPTTQRRCNNNHHVTPLRREVCDPTRDEVDGTIISPLSPICRSPNQECIDMFPSCAIRILASSSPDIKALNLSLASSFPTQLDYRTTRDDRTCLPKHDPKPPHKLQDISNRSDTKVVHYPWRANELLSVMDGRDDPRWEKNSGMARLSLENLWKESTDCALPAPKEDADPNPSMLTRLSTTQTGKCPGQEKDNVTFSSPLREQKHLKSLHRRDSVRSLPSPEQIGPSPLRTPRRQNLSSGISPIYGG